MNIFSNKKLHQFVTITGLGLFCITAQADPHFTRGAYSKYQMQSSFGSGSDGINALHILNNSGHGDLEIPPHPSKSQVVEPPRQADRSLINTSRSSIQEQMEENDELRSFVYEQILNSPPINNVAKDKNRQPYQAGFITPVSYSRISSPYGYRFHPVLKRTAFHTGIDYAAPKNTPIRAAQSGYVVFSGWKGGYGKTVIIKHDDKFSTLYGHAASLNVKSDTWVNKGDVIALVGSTGRSTGNHLHFEVLMNGVAVNPSSYVY